jgi:general secretion pathway protein L
MNMQNVATAAKHRRVGKVRLVEMRVRYLAPVQRRMKTFWSWWIAELLPLLPMQMRSVLMRRDERDFIDCEGDDFVVLRGTMAKHVEIGRYPTSADRRPDVEPSSDTPETILLLPSSSVLVKSMTLPMPAEENLRDVLAFEMERQTPFSSDQVYYDHTVTDRDTVLKAISVDLVVSPREVVDSMLEKLMRCGLRADVVATRTADGASVLPINLLPTSRRANSGKFQRRLNLAFTSVIFALLATAIALPPLQKHQALEELEPQLVEAISQAKSANELRQQVEGLLIGSSYLVEKKRRDPSILRILDELTLALPDHTSINRLEISAGTVQLVGESSAAASLISLLESSPRFEKVTFRSPVTHARNSDKERFHLSAEIEQEQMQ